MLFHHNDWWELFEGQTACRSKEDHLTCSLDMGLGIHINPDGRLIPEMKNSSWSSQMRWALLHQETSLIAMAGNQKVLNAHVSQICSNGPFIHQHQHCVKSSKIHSIWTLHWVSHKNLLSNIANGKIPCNCLFCMSHNQNKPELLDLLKVVSHSIVLLVHPSLTHALTLVPMFTSDVS